MQLDAAIVDDAQTMRNVRREVNKLALTCEQFNANISRDVLKFSEGIVDTLLLRSHEYGVLLRAAAGNPKNGPALEKLAKSMRILTTLKAQCNENSCKENLSPNKPINVTLETDKAAEAALKNQLQFLRSLSEGQLNEGGRCPRKSQMTPTDDRTSGSEESADCSSSDKEVCGYLITALSIQNRVVYSVYWSYRCMR